MIASMTLAEIQAKYADVHTPEEVAQFQENMTNSKKWKVAKGEWTWDGLTHVQLRGRALQYHPGLDMLELYKEHPYKTALRLVPKKENLEDSGDEESEADSDLEEEDDDEADYDDQMKEAAKQYTALKKRMEPPPRLLLRPRSLRRPPLPPSTPTESPSPSGPSAARPPRAPPGTSSKT